jgi:hypothetical protein
MVDVYTQVKTLVEDMLSREIAEIEDAIRGGLNAQLGS